MLWISARGVEAKLKVEVTVELVHPPQLAAPRPHQPADATPTPARSLPTPPPRHPPLYADTSSPLAPAAAAPHHHHPQTQTTTPLPPLSSHPSPAPHPPPVLPIYRKEMEATRHIHIPRGGDGRGQGPEHDTIGEITTINANHQPPVLAPDQNPARGATATVSGNPLATETAPSRDTHIDTTTTGTAPPPPKQGYGKKRN